MSKSFLLDTHALLWFLSGDDLLSKKAKSKIIDSSNSCYISIASLWEIAIKIKLGKLKLDMDFKDLATLLYDSHIEILQITFEHITGLISLEDIHRDPFDRLIISQSKTEKLTIISKDQYFSKYNGLKVVW